MDNINEFGKGGSAKLGSAKGFGPAVSLKDKGATRTNVGGLSDYRLSSGGGVGVAADTLASSGVAAVGGRPAPGARGGVSVAADTLASSEVAAVGGHPAPGARGGVSGAADTSAPSKLAAVGGHPAPGTGGGVSVAADTSAPSKLAAVGRRPAPGAGGGVSLAADTSAPSELAAVGGSLASGAGGGVSVAADTSASSEFVPVGGEPVPGAGDGVGVAASSLQAHEMSGCYGLLENYKVRDMEKTYFEKVYVEDDDIEKAESEYGLLSLIKDLFYSRVEGAGKGIYCNPNHHIYYATRFLKGLTKDGFDGIIVFAAEYNKTTNSALKNFLVENFSEIAYLGKKGAERIVEILKDDGLLEELLSLRKDILTPLARMDEGNFSLLIEALNDDKLQEIHDSGYINRDYFLRMTADSLLKWIVDPAKECVATSGGGDAVFSSFSSPEATRTHQGRFAAEGRVGGGGRY